MSEFTAYRFERGTADPLAAATFSRLGKAGLLPRWRMEAPIKTNPAAPRALLINLPKFNADAFHVLEAQFAATHTAKDAQ